MPTRRPPDDHYATLGVARTATPDALRAAFKARAKSLHPDMNRHRDTTAEFQRLQAAYAILADPRQRELYDLGNLPDEVVVPYRATEDVEAHFRATRTRRRARQLVGLVGAFALGGLIYFLFQWEPDELSSDLPQVHSGEAVSALPGLDQQMQAAIYQGAQNYAGAQQSATSEVEVAGRNGRKYILSGVVARQLEPARNKLVSDAEELRERGTNLKARHDGLERTRRALDPSQISAIRAFNENVEALNRDNAELDRDVESHKKEIEAFFSDVERMALRAL
ncbi:MAG: J domain-containing protein [Verrucomicrobia bacterium]|nr:J domain-containing protein [Verrucomicrobiota bacterium]